MSDMLLSVRDLKVQFPVLGQGLFAEKRYLRAVDGVSFDLKAGETLGVVGESGCGKSTLARAILRLVPIADGTVVMLGENLAELDKKRMRERRKSLQVIFQDPLASLNPRMTVGQIIAEPLVTFYPKMSKTEVRERVQAIMEKVGLLKNQVNRYPHEYSGGQCQRIGIARALILNPKLIICDEPVSALDVSIQAQIVNLLMDLQQELGLALIFIAHDLSVVRHISHRVLVMYLGRAVEIADRDSIYNAPRHPYTRALISAVPIPDPARESGKSRQLLEGEIPSPLEPPTGCTFRTRCPYAVDRCAAEAPALRELQDGLVSCHRAEELDRV